MGSFSQTGFLSHLPIQRNDDAVLLLCTVNSYENTDYVTSTYYVDSQLRPFCLPMYGKYDDHGRIYDIEKSYTVDLFEKVCDAKIDEIIRAIIDNIDNFAPTITDVLERLNKHDYDKDRSTYKILIKLQNFIDKSVLCRNKSKLVVLFEHKDFFLDCCNSPIKDAAFKDMSFNVDITKKCCDILGYKDTINCIIDDYWSNSVRMTAYSYRTGKTYENAKKADMLFELIKQLKPLDKYLFNWKMILPFYELVIADFEKVEIEELANLAGLDHYMRSIHEHLTAPGDWGQETNMKAKKKHYQKCINLIKQLKEKHEL